jgi:hypothetical protein
VHLLVRENLILSRKVNISLISDSNNGTLHEDLYTFFIISCSFLLKMRKFQTKGVAKIKTHILCSITVFEKSFRLRDNVEKFCGVGWATYENTAHVHCMLDA